MAVAQRKPSAAPLKDLYDIGEVPPLGHIPANMHAWAIRKERHGPPEKAMQQEVVPTWPIAEDEVLVYVMAGGVNYNGVWAGLGIPVSPLDGHKHPFHIAGSDASGVVWAVGSKVKRWNVGDEHISLAPQHACILSCILACVSRKQTSLLYCIIQAGVLMSF